VTAGTTLLPYNRGPVGVSVEGEPVRLDPGSGYSLRFRFDPNDIGKVDFRGEPLRIVDGDLML
jgi:hypothetical protein